MYTVFFLHLVQSLYTAVRLPLEESLIPPRSTVGQKDRPIAFYCSHTYSYCPVGFHGDQAFDQCCVGQTKQLKYITVRVPNPIQTRKGINIPFTIATAYCTLAPGWNV